eukprot:2973279-Rhodomonas_salina.2
MSRKSGTNKGAGGKTVLARLQSGTNKGAGGKTVLARLQVTKSAITLCYRLIPDIISTYTITLCCQPIISPYTTTLFYRLTRPPRHARWLRARECAVRAGSKVGAALRVREHAGVECETRNHRV